MTSGCHRPPVTHDHSPSTPPAPPWRSKRPSTRRSTGGGESRGCRSVVARSVRFVGAHLIALLFAPVQVAHHAPDHCVAGGWNNCLLLRHQEVSQQQQLGRCRRQDSRSPRRWTPTNRERSIAIATLRAARRAPGAPARRRAPRAVARLPTARACMRGARLAVTQWSASKIKDRSAFCGP